MFNKMENPVDAATRDDDGIRGALSGIIGVAAISG
jgi:hypothetical protein